MDHTISQHRQQNASYFGLPSEILFCEKCVISNQRPSSTVEFTNTPNQKKEGIHFHDGVCSACRYSTAKEETIDWAAREDELLALLEKYRSKNGEYDVVVPGSGGKDSAFTSHILKYKYGMHPLTVTWAPHLYTEIGFHNFQNWAHVGGLDNILFTPNGRLHRLLTRFAFINLLHPFQPFIIGQKLIGPIIAKQFNIPLIFYGENQAEYGNTISENNTSKMQDKFFISDNVENLRFGGVSVQEIIDKHKFQLSDFKPYFPLNNQQLDSFSLNFQYLGYYLKWDPQECFYYAAKNTGFSPNSERTEGSYSRYSSIDDKIDPFHYFTTYIKFGLGRASYDAAQEIRNKKITREEGVSLVKKYDSEFPNKYYREFLDYISLNEQEFWDIIDRYRSPHLWEKNSTNKEWNLIKTVWNP